MHRTLCVVGALLMGPASVLANDWGNPSLEWSGHLRFNGPSQEQVDLNRADMIKRERGGYYGQWRTTSVTNNYGDTYIENMNSSTSIGSQTVTEVSIVGDNNDVNQQSSSNSSNVGDTSSGIWTTGEGGTSSNYFNN